MQCPVTWYQILGLECNFLFFVSHTGVVWCIVIIIIFLIKVNPLPWFPGSVSDLFKCLPFLPAIFWRASFQLSPMFCNFISFTGSVFSPWSNNKFEKNPIWTLDVLSLLIHNLISYCVAFVPKVRDCFNSSLLIHWCWAVWCWCGYNCM